jgi:DNA-directed RNA polymerase specialized sigma24 family protein
MLRARYMLGVSPREIAKSRGVSRGCVYATCRKALQKIRKNFRKPDQS